MLPLAQMSPEQVQSYRPIWGEFTRIGSQFSGSHSRTHRRSFAFYGSLDTREDGLMGLHDLLVACSCEDTSGEHAGAVRALQEKIATEGCRTVRKEPYHMEGAC